MLIEVVSTPLVKPATAAGTSRATPRWRSCHSAAATTATPTPTWSGSLREGREQRGAERQARHGAARSSGAQQRPAHVVALEQHEHVQHGAEQQQRGHRLRRLHHREQRRREHEREAEAGGRLHGGARERRQRRPATISRL